MRVPGRPCTPSASLAVKPLTCAAAPSVGSAHPRGWGRGLFLTHFVRQWSVQALALESFFCLQIFASICRTCRVGGCRVIFLHRGQIQFPRDRLPWEAAAQFSGARSGICWHSRQRCRLGAGCPTETRLSGSGSSRGAGPESVHFQALGKGFEGRRVPEEGDRWYVHPGGAAVTPVSQIPCPMPCRLQPRPLPGSSYNPATCLVTSERPSRVQPTHSGCTGDAGPSGTPGTPAHEPQLS